jgi:hypothetical protein
MKTLLRALILLLIVLWLGGVMFFPVLAYSAFSSIADTHVAGTIVAKSLRILHYEGLLSGSLIILLLLVAQTVRALPRPVAAPVVVTLIMLGLTAFSPPVARLMPCLRMIPTAWPSTSCMLFRRRLKRACWRAESFWLLCWRWVRRLLLPSYRSDSIFRCFLRCYDGGLAFLRFFAKLCHL